jgi:hypothetical protein
VRLFLNIANGIVDGAFCLIHFTFGLQRTVLYEIEKTVPFGGGKETGIQHSLDNDGSVRVLKMQENGLCTRS